MPEHPRAWYRSPAILFGLVAVTVSILCWPAILGRRISLDWNLGDMTPWARRLQGTLGILAVLMFVLRERIDRLWRRTFATRRQALFAVISIGVAMVLSLAAVETAFRIKRFPFSASSTPSENALARFDDELGWSYIPNHSVTQEFGERGRRVAMHFDAHGARVAAPHTRLDPSKPTLLMVGCSFTMGHGVPYEETMAGHLSSRSGFPYQVVNLGVQGFGTDQALLQLMRHFDDFDTRVVVYSFLGAHIVRDSNLDPRHLHPEMKVLGTKPRFLLNADGEPVLGDRPVRVDALGSLRITDFLNLLWFKWGPRPQPELTRALMLTMKRYVESRNARFILVLWSPFKELPPDHRFVLRGLEENLLRIAPYVPAEWWDWIDTGDGHPHGDNYADVAVLIARVVAR